MFYEEDEELVNEFLAFPYKRKICFVPYQSSNEELISIDYKQSMPNKPFWKIVNGMVSGLCVYYDVMELILNNNFIHIATTKQRVIFWGLNG